MMEQVAKGSLIMVFAAGWHQVASNDKTLGARDRKQRIAAVVQKTYSASEVTQN